jgi:predicted ATPase
VIGKEFALSLLKRVVDQPEDELRRLLSHLQTGEFIYEQPAFPEIEYVFKHALTQEVAYNSLLLERRKGLHERTAQALEALFHNRLEDHYGDLAHHYTRSGNTQKAVEYLQLAGQQAVQRSANAEAISHLTAALESLKTLPDTSERDQRELTLQITLGVSLLATQGLASLTAERAYTRARELCQQLRETALLVPTLLGLGVCYLQQGKLQTARELGEQLLAFAQHQQDSAPFLMAHNLLGMVLFFQGELASALEHSEQGIVLYNPRLHHSLTFSWWVDPGVACLGFAAKTLRLLGYPVQALKRSSEMLALAQELSHPQSLAYALYLAASVHHFRGERAEVQKRAEALLALSHEQGFPLWLAWGTMFRGWALADQGQEEGIAQLCEGLAAFRATGSRLLVPYCLALVAETYGKKGQVEEGLAALVEALSIVPQTGEPFYEAELYRLQGELSLQSRQVKTSQDKSEGKTSLEAEAEECFWKALDVARRQSAKSLELRAAMSLSRLWQQQNKGDEARRMLAEIYGWFTEGFDTADLQEAKALLEELSHRTIGSLDH